MDRSPRYPFRVSDGTVPYGHGPRPGEAFAAAGVLADLETAPTPELAHVLARYTALRCWLLRDGDRDLRRHARSAAREHIAATPTDWGEGALLAELVDVVTAERAIPLLEAAAARAAGSGHGAGARSLRQAAHRCRWEAAGYPPASPS